MRVRAQLEVILDGTGAKSEDCQMNTGTNPAQSPEDRFGLRET
jgi:hypothetical protein